jgi:copper(I)-binding protein
MSHPTPHSRSLAAALAATALLLTACGDKPAPVAEAPPAPTVAAQTAPIRISNASSREAPVAGGTGVGFLSITNNGTKDDQLLAATTPLAGAVELHEMSMSGGMMQMRALPDGLSVPAGKTVELASGGTHLMLTDLKRPLVAGEKVPLTLRFRDAGEIAVELEVKPLVADDGHDEHRGH